MRTHPTPMLLAALAAVAIPSAARAAGGEAPSVFWEVFNIVLLFAVLFYVGRKPVLAFMSQRRQGILDDIAASENLLSEAEARLEEWSGRAERLETDVAEIRQLTSERANRERDRIIEEAQAVADRIQRDAHSAVDRELDRARKTLRQEAADLAVELAGRMLEQNVTDADRTRLVEEFVARIESEGGSAARGNA